MVANGLTDPEISFILLDTFYCHKNKCLDECVVKVLSMQLHKGTFLVKPLSHKVCQDPLEVKNNTKFIPWLFALIRT